MFYCFTYWIDAGDATILSEPEISAEANQLAAPLMFKLPTVARELKCQRLVAERDIFEKESH